MWEHDAPLSNDIWVLDNGNLLFTKGNGVLEVTRNNDTIFNIHRKVMYLRVKDLLMETLL